MNLRQHAAAYRAAISANLGGSEAYGYDDVPDVLPDIYVIVSVTRRFAPAARFNGVHSMDHMRLTTLAVGRTEDEALWAQDRIGQAIEQKPVTIGSGVAYAVFDDARPPVLKDGRYSGLLTWTYAVARTP